MLATLCCFRMNERYSMNLFNTRHFTRTIYGISICPTIIGVDKFACNRLNKANRLFVLSHILPSLDQSSTFESDNLLYTLCTAYPQWYLQAYWNVFRLRRSRIAMLRFFNMIRTALRQLKASEGRLVLKIRKPSIPVYWLYRYINCWNDYLDWLMNENIIIQICWVRGELRLRLETHLSD